MLQLRNVSKSYTPGSFTQKALDDVTISFRANEFVAVLGPAMILLVGVLVLAIVLAILLPIFELNTLIQ